MERLNFGKVTADIPQLSLEGADVTVPAQRESRKDTQPFVIRGHHLDILIDIVRLYSSPEDLAMLYRNGREDERAMTVPKNKKVSKEQIVYINQEKEYAIDVIGTTKKEANLYEKKLTKVFGDFLELTNDHPVKVVIGQKDAICNTCMIGKHCLFKDQANYNAGESVSADGLYLNIFRYVAKKHNLESQITISEEIATFADAEPEKVTAILTNAGVVRQVLDDRSFRRIATLKKSN